jgi:hypothetical protein
MTIESFPARVRELAADRRLGDPVRAFRPRSVHRLTAVLRRRARPVPVYLFAGGLVRPPEAYGWRELSSVTVAGVRRRRRRGSIRWQVAIDLADGRTVRLADGLADIELLGEVIVAEVMRRVVPGYVATVGNGGTVAFGPFTVSDKGIEKDAELIPWPAIGSVGMSNGLVYVRRRDERSPAALPAALPAPPPAPATGADGNAAAAAGAAGIVAVIAARMPNAAAFIALCRHLGAQVDGPA